MAMGRLVGFLRDLPAETHWEKGQGEKKVSVMFMFASWASQLPTPGEGMNFMVSILQIRVLS